MLGSIAVVNRGHNVQNNYKGRMDKTIKTVKL